MTARRVQELTMRKTILQAVIDNGYTAIYDAGSSSQQEYLANCESLTRNEMAETIEEIDAAVLEAVKLNHLQQSGITYV